MRPQEPKGRSIPVAAVAVGGLAALLVVYELMQAPGSSLARIIQVCPQSGFENCTQLQRYSPSVWEAEYSAQMANGSAPSCDLGPRQHERVAAWLAATGSGVPPTSHDVLSTFEWLDTCSGEEFVQHIEPLVGHFRHPLGPHCRKNSSVDIQSRDYILFSGLTPSRFKSIYPGRRLLLDCGTSTYRTGLEYLVQRYRQVGVEFDEIWAWEYAKKDPAAYWAEVPADIKPRLHFYNTGIDANTSSPEHPIAYIKRAVKPGDFLALKLDIDNSPIELAFMEQVGADPDLRAAIGELFFEQHYTDPAMAYWFRDSGGKVTHADVLQHFTKLRQMGVRLHYWP